MGWLITLGILLLLAALPLGVSIVYNEEGARVKALAGLVSVTVFPRPKKAKKPKKETKQESKKEAAKAVQAKVKPSHIMEQKKPEPKKGGSVTDFLPLVKVGLNFLSDFRRKLRVNRLEVKLVLAGDDPCNLATNYGRVWAAVGNLMPKLETWLVIKKRDIDVQCDFTAEETLVTARLDLTITLGRILALAVIYGFRALKEFLKIKNKRKGGVVE